MYKKKYWLTPLFVMPYSNLMEFYFKFNSLSPHKLFNVHHDTDHAFITAYCMLTERYPAPSKKPCNLQSIF